MLGLAAIAGVVVLTQTGSKRHPVASTRIVSRTPSPSASVDPTPSPTAPPSLGAPDGAGGYSPAPVSTASLPGIPAITAHATDLGKEPVIGTGTLPGPTALTTRDLVVGSGAAVTSANTVVVREVSTVFGSGKVLAAWKDAPVEASLPVNDFTRILDFGDPEDPGIVGMKPGGRREIVVPDPDLGGTDEVVVVDLVAIQS